MAEKWSSNSSLDKLVHKMIDLITRLLCRLMIHRAEKDRMTEKNVCEGKMADFFFSSKKKKKVFFSGMENCVKARYIDNTIITFEDELNETFQHTCRR